MRPFVTLCALAACGGAASAQAPASARPDLATSRSPAPQRGPADSLRLSRRQVIAEALARNPQLDVAREQTAEARARRVTATAVPDPALTAAYDQATAWSHRQHTIAA